MKVKLEELAKQLEGDLFDDITTRTLYATDASAYREMPLAVVIPKTNKKTNFICAEGENFIDSKNSRNLIGRTGGG